MYMHFYDSENRTYNNMNKLNKQMENHPAIIIFVASWCGACQQIKPILDEALMQLRDTNINGILARVNHDEIDKIRPRATINRFPTFVKYYKDKDNMFKYSEFDMQQVPRQSIPLKNYLLKMLKENQKHYNEFQKKNVERNKWENLSKGHVIMEKMAKGLKRKNKRNPYKRKKHNPYKKRKKHRPYNRNMTGGKTKKKRRRRNRKSMKNTRKNTRKNKRKRR